MGIPWAWGAHWWFPFVPRPGVPITIVVGPAIPVRPVTPDAAGRTILDDSELDARVEDLRRTYMQRVEALFESQKGVDEVAARKKLRWVPRPQPTAKKAR